MVLTVGVLLEGGGFRCVIARTIGVAVVNKAPSISSLSFRLLSTLNFAFSFLTQRHFDFQSWLDLRVYRI
jgi:hypothetical protein